MQLKRFSEILTRLTDLTLVHTPELNDFSTGSIIRSIYESISMELEQYYILTRSNILWGIEQGVLDGFDFKRRTAKRAYGIVTIEFHSVTQDPVVISRGTSFDSLLEQYRGTVTYEVLQDVVIPSGTTLYDLEVYATTVGTQGNLPQGAINHVMVGLANVKRVYNKEDFLTGADEEALADVKKRFQLFVESRGRSTVKSVEYGARQVEEVSGVYVKEEVGQITVYVHDQNGNLSAPLQQAVERALEDYRPAGINLLVYPVKKRLINLEVTVTLSDKSQVGYDISGQVETAVRNYLNEMTVSKDLILSDLLQAIMNSNDELIYDCDIDNYDKNISVANEEIIRAGDITVNLK